MLVDVETAARMLAVSPTHVRCLLANIGSEGGKRKAKPRLAHVKIGAATRIAVSDLEAFILANRKSA